MRHHYLLTAFIALLALGAGFVLIPRSEEHVTMLARDGRYEQASQLLASMTEAGDRRPQLILQAVALRIKQGDLPGALVSVESYLAVRPVDPGALETYAELLMHAGRLDEHLNVSDRLVRMWSDPARLAHVLAMYRHHGRSQEELALLRHEAGRRQLTIEQYERLGRLLSVRGELGEAARWLRLVDRLAPPAESQGRLALLHVLLESGQADEAVQLADRWLVAWRSPYLSAKLLLRFAQAGAEGAAIALARRCVESMPEAAFQIAGVLTHAAHASISRELLARWVERVTAPSVKQVRDYMHASLAAEERRKPLQMLLNLIETRAPAEIQARFAEEITHAYGSDPVAALLPVLPPELLEARPLLAAELARATGNRRLAGWHLGRVDVGKLETDQLHVWLTILRDVESPRAVLERLVAIWESGRLPASLIGFVAGEVANAGHGTLHNAIWASALR